MRVGLLLEALGLAATAIALSPDITIWQLLPGFALFGTGIGFASSQLNNVILSDVPADRCRCGQRRQQHGPHDRRRVRHRRDQLAAELPDDPPRGRQPDRCRRPPPDAQARAVEQVRTSGVSFGSIPGLTESQSSTIASAVEHAVVSGAKAPLIFSAAIVLLASALSLLIPQVDGGRFADAEDDPAELARQQSEAMGESVAVQ